MRPTLPLTVCKPHKLNPIKFNPMISNEYLLRENESLKDELAALKTKALMLLFLKMSMSK